MKTLSILALVGLMPVLVPDVQAAGRNNTIVVNGGAGGGSAIVQQHNGFLGRSSTTVAVNGGFAAGGALIQQQTGLLGRPRNTTVIAGSGFNGFNSGFSNGLVGGYYGGGVARGVGGFVEGGYHNNGFVAARRSAIVVGDPGCNASYGYAARTLAFAAPACYGQSYSLGYAGYAPPVQLPYYPPPVQLPYGGYAACPQQALQYTAPSASAAEQVTERTVTERTTTRTEVIPGPTYSYSRTLP